VHLVHPFGLDWGDRRVKNDYRDCHDLLTRMRLGKLPEAWIAPPEIRELRELVRYRAKLVALRTGLKAQLKAVLAKHCLKPPVNDLWGVAGPAWLNELELPHGYTVRIESLRDLVEVYDREVAMLERETWRWLRDDAGYQAIQAIDGVGRVLAAGVRGRDRRRLSLPQSSDHLLVGRPHPQAPRVRHQGAPKSSDQAGLEAGALGRHRSGLEDSRWAQGPGRLPPHRRSPGPPHRPSGGGAKAPHPRLLRPARRRDPLPGAGCKGRVSRIGHSQDVRSGNGMIPTTGGAVD
jgi:hypothetical protein